MDVTVLRREKEEFMASARGVPTIYSATVEGVDSSLTTLCIASP
jgi:hypothetical protein